MSTRKPHPTTILFVILVHFHFVLCKSETTNFSAAFQWTFINYTWPSAPAYYDALLSGAYIPENVVMTGLKIHRRHLYVSMPRFRRGVPATLGRIPLNAPTTNPPIAPFPFWTRPNPNDCTQLQSVQSMEIDLNGVMWVIDGVRTTNYTRCPPKLSLYDLEHSNKLLHTFTFTNETSLTVGGFLNDIVLENGFAYITDNSDVDPGLVVYSLRENRAWKMRDRSMFGEVGSLGFKVGGLAMDKLAPIDGIALSPAGLGDRMVYFCALTGRSLYGIGTRVLRDQAKIANGEWRKELVYLGEKIAESDGLAMDNVGNLFYGLLPLYGVGVTRRGQPLDRSQVIAKDRRRMAWTDSFAFDNQGNLFLLSNNVNKFIDPNYPIVITNEARFHIVRFITNTKSYMY